MSLGPKDARVWTAADQAELDVLLHALTFDYWEHRERCEACRPCDELGTWRAHKDECPACRGDAPLTFGPPCERSERWLEHNRRGCVRCLPCPSVQKAIREVVDWHEARRLLSRAEALRADQAARTAA